MITFSRNKRIALNSSNFPSELEPTLPQQLLQQELLDAVALQELPPDEAAVTLPYRLLRCPNGWLACRPEQQVLRLAVQLCDP